MGRTLSTEAIRHIAVFEEVTDASATDCVIDDEGERIVFVVPPGEMATAIGPGGGTVRRLEDRLGRTVELVEGAETAEAFVANALSPAAVTHVTISENETVVAYAEVPDADRGAAIGSGGKNIEMASRLAKRHFGVDRVELA
jgi:transcription termination/antitermination protein NusA